MTTNDNTSLVDELLTHLQGSPMQQIAQQLGTNQEAAGNAVSAALPMLLGALGHNAQQPGGADALFGALQDHMPDPQQQAPQAQALGFGGADLGGLLGGLLGGGAGQSSNAGADILGHIFGGNRQTAEQGLGQATGLGANGGQLLQILAPIVMAYLANRVRSGGMDSGGLGNMLGQEKDRVQQNDSLGGGLLGSILSQVAGGQGQGAQGGLGDLLKMGASIFGKR